MKATYQDGPAKGKTYEGPVPYSNEIRADGALYSFCEDKLFLISEARTITIALKKRHWFKRLCLLPKMWLQWWRFSAGADFSRGSNRHLVGFIWANTKIFMR